MLFEFSDHRFIEAKSTEQKAVDDYELSQFNEKFEWYFKEIKNESDSDLKTRADNLKKHKELLRKGKYFDTEQNCRINIGTPLTDGEVDWIFSNLRCAFYNKVDYCKKKILYS